MILFYIFVFIIALTTFLSLKTKWVFIKYCSLCWFLGPLLKCFYSVLNINFVILLKLIACCCFQSNSFGFCITSCFSLWFMCYRVCIQPGVFAAEWPLVFIFLFTSPLSFQRRYKVHFLFWGCVGRGTLCHVSNDSKFCLECDGFFSGCEMLWSALPYEQGAGRGRCSPGQKCEDWRDIRAVGGARWTLMLIFAKIAPWNLSMIFLPVIPLFIETWINFSFPIFHIWFCYPFLSQGSWQRPGQESCTFFGFLFST